MKDSGVEWIGEIPEEWELPKVKYLFNIGRGRVISQLDLEEKGYPVFSSQTKNNGCLGYISTYDFDRSQLTWTTDGANAGTVFLREGKHNCTNVCGTLMPKNEDNNLFYLKYALEYIAFFHKRADTNGYKIMNNEMAEIKITLPERIIQDSIAQYLNYKITKIEDLIKKTNLVIDEYKLYKQSIITDAVTQGLRKRCLKKTGNVHIPQIPDTWIMKKMKYIFYVKKDIAGKLGYDILSITQKGIKVKDITNNAGQLAADYSNYQIVNVGDFAMNHMDLLTGWVDVSRYNGVTSPDYRVFNFISEEGYSRRYYLYLMQMCYMNHIFYGLGQGVSNLGRWRLQADKFLNFTIPVPPYEEQVEIAKYLDVKCREIDKIVAEKEALVLELENYKKSLIYEYVTGKKEVPVEKVR